MADIIDLANLISNKWEKGWNDTARECLEGIKAGARYKWAEKVSAIRAPDMPADGKSIPYAAYINPNNPDSGAPVLRESSCCQREERSIGTLSRNLQRMGLGEKW